MFRRMPPMPDPFQSTPPARRATAGCRGPLVVFRASFNPRPPRGGRHPLPRLGRLGHDVSIHAPRAEGDFHPGATVVPSSVFQSTPPARRATRGSSRSPARGGCFNPRPPRGGRLGDRVVGQGELAVSIHAPRAEGDMVDASRQGGGEWFQSTPPARRATGAGRGPGDVPERFQSTPPARRATSPMATRAESSMRFNPRPPRGGRPSTRPPASPRRCFNPRPPRGGRRVGRDPGAHPRPVSIHAPRAEGDTAIADLNTHLGLFQSTPPARRATTTLETPSGIGEFQSTPPARRATR